ncbi:MAG: transglycosylase SLT domain-containing protein [Pseudomonadota bacterium]
MFRLCVVLTLFLAAASASAQSPPARSGDVPQTRWSHRADGLLFSYSALGALEAHGAPLVEMTPSDIAAWCPAYPEADPERRRAFWVGFLSALAKHESTWNPRAVGGGGRWFGLLQISPGTARGYGCRARSGPALLDGPDNLSCGIRIMAETVPRDGVIAVKDGRWRGVAADWGPLRSASKRDEMARWLQGRPYCQPIARTRPRVREREER